MVNRNILFRRRICSEKEIDAVTEVTEIRWITSGPSKTV
jgi:dTDP-4-amino-4,6-dideoxygalactose transaminase